MILSGTSTISGFAACSQVLRGSRIRYAEWCKRECVSSAENGESLTVLFREAGLGPELIGEKRIERCMHRWGRQYE